jgi:hypothetical protein
MSDRYGAIMGVRGELLTIGVALAWLLVLAVHLSGCEAGSAELAVAEGALEIEPAPFQPTVTAYSVGGSCAPVSLKTMMNTFNTHGTPEELANKPGVLHVAERGRHLLYHPDGAGEFFDTRYLEPDAPAIQPMPDEVLFTAAEELLDEIGALDAGPVTVARKGIQEWHRDAGGTAEGQMLLTHQLAVFEQRVDKRKAFGPGARIEVVFPGDDFPAAFAHGVRCLSVDETAVALPVGLAIRSFRNRVARGHLWDLYGEQLADPDTVVIQRIRLGHYIPRLGELAEFVDPVYEITGEAKGLDGAGEPVVDEFIWYEPAIGGRGLPTTAPQD